MRIEVGTATLQPDGTWLIEVVHDNGARASQVLSEAASALITRALDGDLAENAKGVLASIACNLKSLLCMQESILVFYGSVHPMAPVLQKLLNSCLVGSHMGMVRAVKMIDQRDDDEQFRQLIERSGLDLTREDDLPG